MKDASERSSLKSRLGWFVLLYLGGVLAVFVLAAALHVLLRAQLQPELFICSHAQKRVFPGPP